MIDSIPKMWTKYVCSNCRKAFKTHSKLYYHIFGNPMSCSSKLRINEVFEKLQQIDLSSIEDPGKNKGKRGQKIELTLGIPNSSSLTDLADGEVKSYTIGETICITQLKHCLDEIITDKVSFEKSKVGVKMNQVLYIGFTKQKDYKGFCLVNKETHPTHFEHIMEDYVHICNEINKLYESRNQLKTITGPNKLLQIRTKASKTKQGTYDPLMFNKHELKNKNMAFYLCSNFGINLTQELSLPNCK